MSTAYQIRVNGHLNEGLSAWFGDFTITHTHDGDTLLTGLVIDQAALHGILARCRDLGITLVSVNPLPAAPAAMPDQGNIKGKLMNWIPVEASHVIDARPQEIYAIVADHHVGHQAIVPRQFFTSLVVEQGGQGAGTVLHGSLKVFGQEYTFHQLVTEPEPGRVMLETDIDTGQWTRWTFEPLNGGTRTRVTITSEFPPTPGIIGIMERWLKPAIIRNIYNKELRQLAEYVRSQQTVTAAPKLA